MKTIIVTTDFSSEAENAMLYAASAVSGLGIKIVLFTLQNISIHTLNARLPSSSFDQILAYGNKMLAETAKNLSQAHQLEVVPHLATGDFYEELERCNSLYSADLVIMGMANRSLEQDLLGNTTTKAIDRLHIPVLAIPLHARFKGIKKILFACDVLRGIHQHIFEQVKNVAHLFGADVEVFHVQQHVDLLADNPLNENIELIHTAFKGLTYFYKNVESTRIVAAIKEEMLNTSADLLIMLSHRHGFWEALVHRSKTRLMASGADTPLLTIPLLKSSGNIFII